MIKFLGIGSCFNTDMGNTSAYYLKDGRLTLFDCGEMTFDRILKVDLLKDVSKVDVYITHLHSDHVGSLPSLIFYLNLVLNITPNVYFPNDDIVKFLTLGNIPKEYYNYVKLEEDKNKLYFVKQKHLIAESAFGYIMKIEDKWIYYSGDTSSFNLNIKFEPGRGFYWIDKDILILRIYHDVTKYINEAHTNIHTLAKLFTEEAREYVTAMHVDDEETIKLARSYGFKIAVAIK